MAVTFADLRNARPGDWATAADAWMALAGEAEGAADTITERGASRVADNWTDAVGEQAGDMLDRLRNSFATAGATMHGVVSILDSLAESVGVLQRSLAAAVDFAGRYGIAVSEAGQVVVPPGYAGPVNVPGDADRLIREAVDSASRIDDEARAQLAALGEGAANGDRDRAVNGYLAGASQAAVGMLAEALPIGQDAATVEAWWNSLSAQDRAALERAVPVELHDLDGVPQDVKDRLTGAGGGYNPVEAVRWARENAFNTENDIFDNNCANFVSQALANGGLDAKVDPSQAEYGGRPGPDTWVRGSDTGIEKLDNFTHSPSWYNAAAQADFLVRNGSDQIPLDSVRPGDLVYFEQNAPNGPGPVGEIHHVAVVTGVTPDGDILYTQHTDPRLNASLDGRLPTIESGDGDQKVLAIRPRETW